MNNFRAALKLFIAQGKLSKSIRIKDKEKIFMSESTWISSGQSITPGKMDNFAAWVKRNRDTVVGALVITIVATIFGIWVVSHYSQVREAAWKNLFIAQQTGFSGNFDEATKQLDSLTANFSRTNAMPYAGLTKGDFLFRQNKFAEAAQEYTKVSVSAPDLLKPFAVYNMGKAKEANADLAGAQADYRAFLTAYPEHFLAPEVQTALANSLELANNQAEAKSIYEKITLLYPDTTWATSAKAKLEPPQAAKPVQQTITKPGKKK